MYAQGYRRDLSMTPAICNAAPPKSTKSRNSNSLVQIQIKPKSDWKSQFEFVLRDTEKSEFRDLVNFGEVALSVEAVIPGRAGETLQKVRSAVWILYTGHSCLNICLFCLYQMYTWSCR